MNGFLVGVNLTCRVDVWLGEEFDFVADINDMWTDTEIWNYARSHDLTILTKDSDFANRIILTNPPPKIVHFRVGNMRLSEFVTFLDIHWQTIKLSSERHKLVTVYRHDIGVIE